jgi:acetyltransferase
MSAMDEKTPKTLERIFKAQTVAVVGVSTDPNKLGFMALNSLIRAGYEGKIYPVNPKGGEILGLKVYSSLSEVPGRPDLVVIIVPANFVPEVLREAAKKGIPGAVILSAGFREVGRGDLEVEIGSISKDYGIRVMGPNIQGINYLPNKLCAMFFPVITVRGPLTIISQSGSVTAALSEWAADEGLGISAAVNLGNQVDLCESDYLDFFATDEHTKAVIVYLEGVKDGGQFLETIGRVAAKKPIAVLKSGRTIAGQKSVASHTGSLAGNSEVFSAACRQFGVVRANDLETLYDFGKAMATMREPEGNRILTISTSGGACTLTVDELEVHDLVAPALPKEFVDRLKNLELFPLATLSNPLDLASISAEHFRQVVSLADQFNLADVFLLNFADPVVGAHVVVKELSANIGASLAVSFMGGGKEEKIGRVKLQEAGIPVFPTPERAVRGIAAVIRAKHYKQRGITRNVEIRLMDQGKRNLVNGRRRGFIVEPEAIRYLKQYNVPYPEHGLAHNVEGAVEIANRLGYPVVLKIVSPEVPHKSDVGGVKIGLENAEDVGKGFGQIIDHVRRAMPNVSIKDVLVCKQVPQGFDVIVGALRDPVFGPTIMFGLGGIYTEILRDNTFRIAPLGGGDAEEMIRETKGFPLLMGARGQISYDIDQLKKLLLSVSKMVIDSPDIMELDLNPVRLFGQGLMVLDVRLIGEKPPGNTAG